VEAPTSTVRCIVTGHVQGVFYRARTADKANELGLSGWARNLNDGSVEIVAAGDSQAIADLAAWLWEGAPAARVDSVTVVESDETVPPGFHTL
jgi:acylphosphatase